MKSKQQKGFTLIELLVVVSIIGTLASVIITNLGEARARARETAFVAGITQLQKSLELYYLDNGEYPDSDVAGSWGLVSIRYANEYNYTAFKNQLDGYVSDIPISTNGAFWRYDSEFDPSGYCYCRPPTNNNQDYVILFETTYQSYGDSFIGMNGPRFRHCLRNPD